MFIVSAPSNIAAVCIVLPERVVHVSVIVLDVSWLDSDPDSSCWHLQLCSSSSFDRILEELCHIIRFSYFYRFFLVQDLQKQKESKEEELIGLQRDANEKKSKVSKQDHKISH